MLKKLENLIHYKLTGLANNIKNIIDSPNHADGEIQGIHEYAKKLPKSEAKDKILFYVLMSGRDITAAKRMLA